MVLFLLLEFEKESASALSWLPVVVLAIVASKEMVEAKDVHLF